MTYADSIPCINQLRFIVSRYIDKAAYLRRLLRRAAAAVAVKHAEQRRGRARARQLGLGQRHILVALHAVRQPSDLIF